MTANPRRSTATRWLKFNLVGGIGIAVQLLMLIILKTGLHFDYLIATASAVETAVVHNFFWHERFTWADRPPSRVTHSLARLGKFNASNGAVSIVGNLVLMRLLVGELKFNYVASNLVAIVLCSLVNFLLNDRFDIWKVAIDGSEATMLTSGMGRKTRTQLRSVGFSPRQG